MFQNITSSGQQRTKNKQGKADKNQRRKVDIVSVRYCTEDMFSRGTRSRQPGSRLLSILVHNKKWYTFVITEYYKDEKHKCSLSTYHKDKRINV